MFPAGIDFVEQSLCVYVDCWLPVWGESTGQPSSEGDSLYCDGASVGYSPDCASAQPPP